MDTVHIGFPNLVYVPVGSRIEKKKKILRNWGVTRCCTSFELLFFGTVHGAIFMDTVHMSFPNLVFDPVGP